MKPGKQWFNRMNKLYAEKMSKAVRLELEQRSDLKELLSYKLEAFIDWAGRQRLNYEDDLQEEVNDFMSGDFRERTRMHVNRADEWMKLKEKVFKRDNYTCVYCGATNVKLECDHIIPFSRGGSDDMANLATACNPCNRAKGFKSVEEFTHNYLKKN